MIGIVFGSVDVGVHFAFAKKADHVHSSSVAPGIVIETLNNASDLVIRGIDDGYLRKLYCIFDELLESYESVVESSLANCHYSASFIGDFDEIGLVSVVGKLNCFSDGDTDLARCIFAFNNAELKLIL